MRIRLSRQLSSYRFLTFHSKVYVILLLEESLQLSQLSVMKIEGDEIYKLCTYSVERSVNAKDVIVTRKHQIVLLEKGHVVHGSIGNDLVPLKIETKS